MNPPYQARDAKVETTENGRNFCSRTRLPGRAAALALFAILAGCAVYQDLEEKVIGKALPCPRVSILADAATITRFKEGAGRDLIDVDFKGSLTGFQGSCGYDIDEDTDTGTLSLDLAVAMNLERGPANKSREIIIEYFISITDPSKNILNKEIFTAKVTFPGNLTVLRWSEDPDDPVVLKIPLMTGERGRDFIIFVGFQLSPEEYRYNRRQGRTNL